MSFGILLTFGRILDGTFIKVRSPLPWLMVVVIDGPRKCGQGIFTLSGIVRSGRRMTLLFIGHVFLNITDEFPLDPTSNGENCRVNRSRYISDIVT